MPFLAGGPVDALARVVAQHLQNRLGQNVIVENRSGGGTTIGAKAVAAAPPDGYTLLVIGPNIAYYPVLFPDLDFDPAKALAPVATAGHLVAPDRGGARRCRPTPFRSWWPTPRPIPASSRSASGSRPCRTSSAKPSSRPTGIDIIDVPYRGGEQARADLLGGRVHINIAPVPQLLPLIRDGKIRALAYTGPQRSPELPDVPTMAESGYPQVGFNPDVWMGVLAPAGTPAAIVDKLNREMNAVLKSDEMAPALKRFGYEAKITTPAEFAMFFAAELRKWPPILKATGIKPQ